MQDDDKVILVKSGGAILGPLSKIDVIDRVMKKHFSLIDEVKWPLGRWTYIRETPEFLAAAEQVRIDIDLDAETQTDSLSARTEQPPLNDDLTPTPVGPVPNSTIRDVTPKEVGNQSSQGVQFGSPQDPGLIQRIRSQQIRLKRGILFLSTLILFGTGWKLYQDSNLNHRNYDLWRAQATKFDEAMLYDKALALYRQILVVNPKDEAAALRSWLISLQLETSNVPTASSVILEPSGKELLPQWLLGQFYFHLKNDDKMKAHQSLERFQQISQDKSLALALSIFMDLELGQFASLSEKLKSQDLQPYSHYILWLQGLYLLLNPTSPSLEDIKIWSQKVDMSQKRLWLIREFSFLRSTLFQKYGLKEESEKADRDFVANFYLGDLSYTFPLELPQTVTPWGRIPLVCERDNSTPLKRARFALCLVASNQEIAANKILEEALLEFPKDPWLTLAIAQLYFKLRKVSEAAGVIGNLNLKESAGLRAMICSENSELSICRQFVEAVGLSSLESLLKIRRHLVFKEKLEAVNEAQKLVLDEPYLLEVRELLANRGGL